MPLVGKKCYQAFHGRQERCEVCPTHTALETGRAAYDVVPKTGPGGTIVGWLDLFSFPLVERETGEFTGVIEYVRDITERKRTEEALRESEEKYRAVISGASDGIVLFDMVGNVLESNTAAEELLGYSKEELRGVHFAQFAVPREKARLENGFAELIRTGRGFVNDVLAERKDGSTFSIDITGSVIGYAGMKVVQGIFRDVSERKRIELMKENLIRDVSHELKAPIAMMEMAQAMCREAVDAGDMDGVGKALQMTARNLKTLSRDVGSILSSFTLRGRRGERPKRLVSLARVIRAVADDLRPLMAQKKLRFRVDIAAGADKVAVERRGLRMLVYNIMDNAVKFTKRGGISVTARPEENWVRLRMRDTGLGIAAKDGPSLFERFYKANPAIQGTGLGLSICKEIAEMYGGMITVESEGAGRGTTVTVTLPRRL
jgi:PAS domain S-box-containing protein